MVASSPPARKGSPAATEKWAQVMAQFTAGVLVLAIGVLFGRSIFIGDPTPVDYAWDLAGVGLVLWGLWERNGA